MNRINNIPVFVFLLLALNIITVQARGFTSQNDAQFTQQRSEEEEPVRIRLLARSYNDSIVLRWAPDEPVAWSLTNRFGYRIARSYTDENGEHVHEVLVDSLRPWSLERMMGHFAEHDTLAALAAELIHGEGLLPTDVTGESDGFVENIIRQREMQETRFAYAMLVAEFSSEVAKAMALRFTDTRVEQGKSYQYFLSANTPEDIIPIRSAWRLVECGPPPALLPPEELDVRQLSNDRIELAWSRDRSSAFFIERSTDGGQTYNRVNSSPYYSTAPDPTWDASAQSPVIEFYSKALEYYHLFSDTVTPGITYHYRVQGIDPFTDLTPFTTPVIITPEYIDPVAAPMIISCVTHEQSMVRIAWMLNENETGHTGFNVEKGLTEQGPWEVVNPEPLLPDVRHFIDSLAHETGGGHYRVSSLSPSGKPSYSSSAIGFVEDFDPPSPPEGLNGIVYHDGIVELFWDPSPEDDVRGYRVAYANQADHEFIMLTPYPVSETYFRDTIIVKTLTRKIYYKVLAEDWAGNFSPYSEMLELTRPDIIPPVTPLLLDALQDAGTVTITWAPSPSSDLLAYRIFRRQRDSEMWEMISVLMRDEVEGDVVITDQPTPSPIAWEYAIEAVDEAGNLSELSRPVSFTVLGSPVPEIPISLTARFDEENRQVNLEWECDSPFPYYIMLLRAEDDSPMMPLTTLVSEKNNYSDRRFRSGTRLAYTIRLRLEDGRQSQPSQTVVIEIP